MRIHLKETSLLVVDIQEKFVPHIDDYTNFLKKTGQLVQGLQLLDLDIAITEQNPKSLGATVPEIQNIVPNNKAMEKIEFSCYDAQPYKDWLKAHPCKNVIICGIEAHICVLQTALDLKEAGYTPIMVLDALSSRFPTNKQLAFDRYQQEGFIISSVESILFELMRTFAHPEAKNVSKLIK